VLDGQGADEIFAGYLRHQFTVLNDYIRRRALMPLLRDSTWLLRHDAKVLRDLFALEYLCRTWCTG
jgi:asparagine synthetase B (glutamine-hydrolysing)